jgi:putative transposase
LVIPGLPHHVTQRGNGRARTFFDDDDYALYRDLLAENCRVAAVEVWAWCLMPNHVHLILVPADADGLRRARLERATKRTLRPGKRGPKARPPDDARQGQLIYCTVTVILSP